MMLMEKLTNATLQSNGMAPLLVVWLVRGVVALIWFSHDRMFAPVFGGGDGLDDACRRLDLVDGANFSC